MPRRLTRIRIESWGGLNLNTPKAMLRPEETAWLENFLGRRGGSLALRPGYARMRHGSPVVQLTEIASDDFNRANTVLAASADWEDLSGLGGTPLAIVTSGIVEAGSLGAEAGGASKWTSDSLDGDQYAECEIIQPGVQHACGVGVRHQVPGDGLGNGYRFGVFGYAFGSPGPSYYLSCVWDFVSHANVPYTWSSGDKIRMEIIGDEIRCYLNGQLQFKLYDSTKTGGQPYLWAYSFGGGATTIGQVDSFVCGECSLSGRDGIVVDGVPAKAFHFERDDGTVLLVISFGGKFQAFQVGDVEWTS